jgi:hypothetical protein
MGSMYGFCCSGPRAEPVYSPPLLRIIMKKPSKPQYQIKEIHQIDNKEKDTENLESSSLHSTINSYFRESWSSRDFRAKQDTNDRKKLEIEKPKTIAISSACDNDVSCTGWDVEVKSVWYEIKPEGLLVSSEDALDYDNKSLILEPRTKFTSEAADQFDHINSQKEGECWGVRSWELCWLRGDGGNTPTDYHKTMNIARELMASEPERLLSEVPIISRKDLRDKKKELADAYIEFVPSSRRRLTQVTIAVNKVWEEVTEKKNGQIEVNEQLYKKELAWLHARKSSPIIRDNEHLSQLAISLDRSHLFLHSRTGVSSPRTMLHTDLP